MRVFVTGGSGFLGRRIIELLLSGGSEVRAYARRPLPELEAMGAETVTGGFGDAERLLEGMEGCQGVIHAAGKTGVWGPLSEYVEANFKGTEQVSEAARRAGVPNFVYTSTPSVAHRGRSLRGATEDAPYVTSKRHGYPYSKMLAERLVLGLDSPGFRTLALRPHLIWGPGDPHFLPRIFRMASRGRLRFFSGGPHLVSHTFIDNAAHAHVHALERLAAGARVSGLSYFIAEPEPMDVKALVNRILACGGRPPVEREVPPWLGRLFGTLCELLWTLLPLRGEPPMPSFTAVQLSTSSYFDLTRAGTVLGWKPAVGTDEGFERLTLHLKDNPPA